MAKKRKLDGTSAETIPSSPSADENPSPPASDPVSSADNATDAAGIAVPAANNASSAAENEPPTAENAYSAADDATLATDENPPTSSDVVPMEIQNPNDPIEAPADANGSISEPKPKAVIDVAATPNAEPQAVIDMAATPNPEPEAVIDLAATPKLKPEAGKDGDAATKPELETVNDGLAATKPDHGGAAATKPEPEAVTDVAEASKCEPEEEEEESVSLRELLYPLSKEQLIDLILDFTSRDADMASKAADVAGADPSNRKVFVHGLGWDTNSDALASAFSCYGEIEDCNAVRDKSTGKTKGYGFVLFKDRSSARAAIREPQKKIGSRVASCQLASAGPPPVVSTPTPSPTPLPTASEYTQRKIYVSNVSSDIDPQKLLQFFGKYGDIEEGPLGLDKQTGKPRGFCLFVYKSVESARKALEDPHKSFEGHTLHCQKAIDGPKWHKGGGSGRGGGGWGQQQQHHVSHSGGHYAKTGYAVARGHAAQSGHLMAPTQQPPPPVGYGQNPQQPPPAGINPAIGQALTALLTNPNAGLGLTNLLGSLGSTGQAGGQGVPPPGASGGYGNQGPGMGGGYGGQPYGAGRGQPGGHFGGGPSYMGR